MTIKDTDLVDILARCDSLQAKLDTVSNAHVFCYPSLYLSSRWTWELDSPDPDNALIKSACKLTYGTPTTPFKIEFRPIKRPQGFHWANAYVLHRNPFVVATNFAFIVTVTLPTAADIANCNRFEMDFQCNDGHSIFNLGWQFSMNGGLVLWNRYLHRWVTENPIATSPFIPGVAKRIVTVFSRSVSTVTYRGIAVDDTFTPLNLTFPSLNDEQMPYLNNAVQLDSKGQGAPITALISDCSVGGF